MPTSDYQTVSQFEDDDKETVDDLNTTSKQSKPNHTISVLVNKRLLIALFVLVFFNMILAAGNAYYSVRISQLLKQYEEKALDSLPRIDPFDGAYRPATMPAAGKY